MGAGMSDYKELLDALDGMDFFCDRAGKELWFDKPKEVQDEDVAFHHKTLTEAISAIEQIVKERDAAISDLRETAQCKACKHFGTSGMTCDALAECLYGETPTWEWRGVREGANE